MEKKNGGITDSKSTAIIDHTVKLISNWASRLSYVFLVAMVVMTALTVIMRYIFNSPIKASDEYSQYMVVIVGFLGLGICAIQDKHLQVELLVKNFPPKIQVFFEFLNYTLTLIVCFIFGAASIKSAIESYHFGLASSITKIPQWPFYLVVMFGFLLLFVVMLTRILRILMRRA